jgi:hypothetical protein
MVIVRRVAVMVKRREGEATGLPWRIDNSIEVTFKLTALFHVGHFKALVAWQVFVCRGPVQALTNFNRSCGGIESTFHTTIVSSSGHSFSATHTMLPREVQTEQSFDMSMGSYLAGALKYYQARTFNCL